jgi:hypothetical protein
MDGTEAELMCEHCDAKEGLCDDPAEAEDDRQFRELLSPNDKLRHGATTPKHEN